MEYVLTNGERTFTKARVRITYPTEIIPFIQVFSVECTASDFNIHRIVVSCAYLHCTVFPGNELNIKLHGLGKVYEVRSV